MANEEVLGPRKTMFVLVIVVGCFAVLWPRILSPLILGHTRDQLKPNQFDREAGCCEMIFESEVAVLELLNEVCSSIVHTDGKLSPYGAAECRKTVNETCGVDIAAFLKRDQNVGKTTKRLLDMMKSSNSSCLKEHFGVPQWSVSSHMAFNAWTLQDTVKQERPSIRTGTHPALRERGRAIAPGAPAAAPTRATPIAMPPHVRVRSSPLDGYFEIDVKPPPIPGMRPPLGSPGGPVPAPKSSMGFVMPIYTICIVVFFVYTLSKILFKRTDTMTYESVAPDPQFRRRVFRDDSRTTPDKLGDEELEALRARLAETERAMQRIVGQLAKRDAVLAAPAHPPHNSLDTHAGQQDNHARPYTNGTVLHNTGPVHIVASEYREQSKDKSPEPAKESTPEPKESTPEPKESTPEPKEPTPEPKEPTPEPEESSPEPKDSSPESEMSSPEAIDSSPELEDLKTDEETNEQKDSSPELINIEAADINHKDANVDHIKLSEGTESVKDESLANATKEFLNNVKLDTESSEPKQSTPELLEEALKEESPEKDSEDEDDEEKATVKVVGMEVTAHTADGGAWRPPPAPPAPAPAARPHEAQEVKSIFLEGDIPQQSRVLVAEFGDRADDKRSARHSPMVVSGKMTLSLIQDAPRDTPERDLESTVDEFTTASAATLPAEKDDNLSDEEIEEEIEVEEIEEEVDEEVEEEDEEEEEETRPQQRKPPAAQAKREQ